jgi:hypothetical protein
MRLVDEPKFCAISVQLISSAFLSVNFFYRLIGYFLIFPFNAYSVAPVYAPKNYLAVVLADYTNWHGNCSYLKQQVKAFYKGRLKCLEWSFAFKNKGEQRSIPGI